MNERYQKRIDGIMVMAGIEHLKQTYQKLVDLVENAYNDGYNQRLQECKDNEKEMERFLKGNGTKVTRKT